MTHHYWGDEWFEKNGDDLAKAMRFIFKVWRMGLIGTGGCKEKYGTLRDHTIWWDGGLHGLIWPGHVYIRNRLIYCYVDRYLVKPFTKYTGLHRLGHWIQGQFYNYAIQTAAKRWPNIVPEITVDLWRYEYVKPGIFGPLDGKEIHERYWEYN